MLTGCLRSLTAIGIHSPEVSAPDPAEPTRRPAETQTKTPRRQHTSTAGLSIPFHRVRSGLPRARVAQRGRKFTKTILIIRRWSGFSDPSSQGIGCNGGMAGILGKVSS